MDDTKTLFQRAISYRENTESLYTSGHETAAFVRKPADGEIPTKATNLPTRNRLLFSLPQDTVTFQSLAVTVCTTSLTYLLTPWCRVPLELLTGLQLVKKFPTFHGTRRFITALTTVRHQCLSWASPIQSIYPHPTSWRSFLILSTHLRLGLPSGLLTSGFATKTLYTPFSSPIRATCPAHLFLFDFITRTILGEG